MPNYLTFQEPTTVDGLFFWPGSQWEDFVSVGGGSSKTYTVTVDGIDYAGITIYQAFVMDKALDLTTTNGMAGFEDRIMPHPDNGDYYDAVKMALDIDMTINHEPQYSGSDPHLHQGEKNPGKHLKSGQ